MRIREHYKVLSMHFPRPPKCKYWARSKLLVQGEYRGGCWMSHVAYVFFPVLKELEASRTRTTETESGMFHNSA